MPKKYGNMNPTKQMKKMMKSEGMSMKKMPMMPKGGKRGGKK